MEEEKSRTVCGRIFGQEITLDDRLSFQVLEIAIKYFVCPIKWTHTTVCGTNLLSYLTKTL